jgi:metallo-beta-lactamase class B
VLKGLPCDVFLGAHGSYYEMEAKFAQLGKVAGNPFVDPAGYRAYVLDCEHTFQAKLARQKAERRS